MIDYTDPDLRDGISGGAEISGGNMTVQESKDLAFVLNTGALPVKLEPAYQQQVSATLGKDSLQPGASSPASSASASCSSTCWSTTASSGLVADLALIVYGILLWGLFNAIPVTLTLPGIAGMILTIGVAADANVVIFERIKEEVRHGKTVRTAVNSGYARGFKTILDANILTMLTAARAVRVRHRPAQGLRLHAHPRRARQHAHRGAVHARHARRAGRLRVLQQAGLHGRARRPDRGRRAEAGDRRRPAPPRAARRAATAGPCPPRRPAPRRSRAAGAGAAPSTSRKKKKRR